MADKVVNKSFLENSELTTTELSISRTQYAHYHLELLQQSSKQTKLCSQHEVRQRLCKHTISTECIQHRLTTND